VNNNLSPKFNAKRTVSKKIESIARIFAVIMIIIIIVLAAFSYILIRNLMTLTATSTITTNNPSSDYTFFIQPNLAREEKLREWFMSPFDLSSSKAGYDPTYGMIRGGYWSGEFQDGFVLIDTQLIVANTLDYLNSQVGVSTHIQANLEQWLKNTTFIDPQTGATGTYNGDDRREILFGKNLQCVMKDSGQIFYVPGHTLNDTVPITTALPTGCTSPSSSTTMNYYALWIELYYLQGNINQAKQMFETTLGGWVTTPGTGVGGTTGGYFSSEFDSGNCKNTRTLGYWIDMARATGFWNLTSESRTVAQEAMNEIWAHQLPSGGMSVNYPGCGNPTKDSGESSGITLDAFDPRVPSFFGHNSSSGTLAPSRATSGERARATTSLSFLFLGVRVIEEYPDQFQLIAPKLVTLPPKH
jgi:hypothetical protein